MYGKLKGKFSDGEMNDRFTVLARSPVLWGGGESPVFQVGKIGETLS
jgi:hypothetical protein